MIEERDGWFVVNVKDYEDRVLVDLAIDPVASGNQSQHRCVRCRVLFEIPLPCG